MRPRFRRRPSAGLVLLVLLAAAVAARLGWDAWQRGFVFSGQSPTVRADGKNASFLAGPCTVVQVVSGDTLVVRQVQSSRSSAPPHVVEGPVRLLGVQIGQPAAPSVHGEPSAVGARTFIEEFVGRGGVALQLDKRRLDADGRLLAYVLVEGQMLNVELVRQGFALRESKPGDSETISRQLRQAEDEARLAGRGIWKRGDG
ncbi:MAG TPA: thermonuclease family protein [Pirellulaceae bacterium]|nr:thermonuclease family protein [Pirellulaceae bacterium]